MPSILSFDIDLNRVHAWSSLSGRVCYNETVDKLPVQQLPLHDITLIEVGSNIFYNKKPEVVHRTAAWLIFNTYVATLLWNWHRGIASSKTLLVSPSSSWTLGHEEPIRHAIADVTGDNHDIREARCMQFFYLRNPEKWVSFDAYFNGFTFKQSEATKLKNKTNRAALKRCGKTSR